MTGREPATRRANATKTPACSKCGTRTLLFGIEPGGPGQELLSFECPTCQHIETVLRSSTTPHFSESF